MARPESPFTAAELTSIQKHLARRVREKRRALAKHNERETTWTRGPSDWKVLRKQIVSTLRFTEALLEKVEAHRADIHRYEAQERSAA